MKKIKMVGSDLYEYEQFPLVDKYDDVLYQKLDPFYFDDSIAPRTPVIARNLAVSLLETMKYHGGVGLAANQVGIPLRVFVAGYENAAYAFFNPEILETSGEMVFDEGCLSFLGLYLPIKRPDSVLIKYQDMNGEWQEKHFTGFTARIILHEYDHMEGVVFTSKVPSLILDKAKTKVANNLKKLKKQKEIRVKEELIAQAIKNVSKTLEKSNT